MRDRMIRTVLDHPWLALIAVVCIVAGLASGARHLTFSNDYRMFFSEDNPQLQAFESMQNTYTKNDNVLFMLAPADGEVFTRPTLAAVEWLTEASWQTPYSIRVDSITNFQHTAADGDDLVVEDLVSEAESLDDDAVAAAHRIAVAEPLLRDRLISPDGAYTGVNITVQLPGKSLGEVPEVATFVRELANEFRARYADIEIRVTGIVMMNNAFPEASLADMQTLYPLMLALILVVLAIMLRSLIGTLSTALVILLTIVTTMGITGWLGIQLSPPTTSVPVIVMTLAIADCVHILVNYQHGLRDGLSKYDAMHESLRINLTPITITSVTTAIGFMSLNFSDAPPFRDLGNMSAIGVMTALVLSIVLLPALIQLLPMRSAPADARGSDVMERFAEFVIRNRERLFWGMGLLILALIAQIPRNELNDEYVKYFDETIAFRADTDFVTERLTGIYRIDYSLPAESEGAISDPVYLQHVEAFANWLRQQPRVLHVQAITDIMKRLNKNMHSDAPDWYRLPDERDLSAQYLLLYEFSLPFGLDLNDRINVKKSATRLSLIMESVSSNEVLELEARARQWLIDNAPAYMVTEGASPSLMFAHIGYRNIRSSLTGATLALVIISGILIFAFRSLRVGLLSLVPNLIPVAIGFGIWGLFVGRVGLALSIVAGITMGIVVDDTVHFLSKYLRARRERGMDGPAAVRYAFGTVGTALWVTSLVLVMGFGVLALSHFEINAGMGQLTAITIAVALIADFLFLPPLLLKFAKEIPDARAAPDTV